MRRGPEVVQLGAARPDSHGGLWACASLPTAPQMLPQTLCLSQGFEHRGCPMSTLVQQENTKWPWRPRPDGLSCV